MISHVKTYCDMTVSKKGPYGNYDNNSPIGDATTLHPLFIESVCVRPQSVMRQYSVTTGSGFSQVNKCCDPDRRQ